MQTNAIYIFGLTLILYPVIAFFLGFMRTRSTFTLINNGAARGFSIKEASMIWVSTSILLWIMATITLFLTTSSVGVSTLAGILVAILMKDCFFIGSNVAEYAIERERDFLRNDS